MASRVIADVSLAPIVRALTSVSYGALFSPIDLSKLWVFKDLPYLPGSENAKHRLDVTVVPPSPAETKRPLAPILFFVHGGSWSSGDKRLSLNLYSNLGFCAAQHGESVGVVTNYRLSPEVRFPEHLDDLAASLSWVMRNAPRYGGDKRKVVLCGHSAGAHLATSLALRWPEMKRKFGDGSSSPLPDISGLISLSGAFNVLRLGQSPFAPALTEPAFGKDEAFLRAASPAYTILDAKQGTVQQQQGVALLSRIPVMLLNAQEDFHLASDAEELDLALSSSSSSQSTDEKTKRTRQERLHHYVAASTGSATASSPSTTITWLRAHALNVIRGAVPATNHITVVGGIGSSPKEPTTAAIAAFLRMIGGGAGGL